MESLYFLSTEWLVKNLDLIPIPSLRLPGVPGPALALNRLPGDNLASKLPSALFELLRKTLLFEAKLWKL